MSDSLRHREHATAGLVLAASYARKSTEDALGIGDQHNLNAKTAAANGHSIPDNPAYRFDDDGVTGAIVDRPGLCRLLDIVRKGAPFQYVYVKDITRVGRFDDPAEMVALSLELRKRGVPLVRGNRPLPIGRQSDAELMAELLTELIEAGAATQERKNLIRRVTGGMADRVRRGFYPGSAAPYGLERWLVDPTTGTFLECIPAGRRLRQDGAVFGLRAADDGTELVVQRIFSEFEAGTTRNAIARALNAEAVASPGTSRDPDTRIQWTEGAVTRILTNPLYMGELWWGARSGARSGDLVDATTANVATTTAPLRQVGMLTPPLIEPERWHAVQQVLSQKRAWRATRPEWPTFRLSGLLSCARCGGDLHGAMSTSKAKTRRRYYRHSWRSISEKGCPDRNRYLRADDLEVAILGALTPIIESGELAEMVERGLRALLANQRTVDHSAELERRRRGVDRIARALDKATLSMAHAESGEERDSHSRTARALADKLATEKAGLSHLEAAVTSVPAAAVRWSQEAAAWLTPTRAIGSATAREQSMMLRSLVSEIKLDIPRMELTVEILTP